MSVKVGDFIYIRHLDEVAVCKDEEDGWYSFWLPVADNRGLRWWCCIAADCPEPLDQTVADCLRPIADAIWRLEEVLKCEQDRFIIASNLARKEGTP